MKLFREVCAARAYLHDSRASTGITRVCCIQPVGSLESAVVVALLLLNGSKWTGLALEHNSLEVGRYGLFVILVIAVVV